MHKGGPSTRSVRGVIGRDAATRAIMPPIAMNVAFSFDDLESWRAVAHHEAAGDIYTRNSNPTTRILEQKLADMEGAEAATSFATGMAAISTTLFSLLNPNDRAVTVKDAYGATFLLFTQVLPRFGIETEVCDTDDMQAIERSIAKGCRVLYLESPTNPMLKVVDLKRLIAAARAVGAVTIVDNTFATPINQNPISLGADLVIHSATKFLSGHGDVLGGIACGRRELVEKIYRHRELIGTGLDAQSAFAIWKSLKTLGLRVERQNANAIALAKFMQQQPQVERVHYPGLETHVRHDVAKRQMTGFGGVFSFELKGGMDAVRRFLPRLRLAYLAANLGQVETIVGPAYLTSHIELNEAERAASGVPDTLIRFAVGIEDVEDLRLDLLAALSSL